MPFNFLRPVAPEPYRPEAPRLDFLRRPEPSAPFGPLPTDPEERLAELRRRAAIGEQQARAAGAPAYKPPGAAPDPMLGGLGSGWATEDPAAARERAEATEATLWGGPGRFFAEAAALPDTAADLAEAVTAAPAPSPQAALPMAVIRMMAGLVPEGYREQAGELRESAAGLADVAQRERAETGLPPFLNALIGTASENPDVVAGAPAAAAGGIRFLRSVGKFGDELAERAAAGFTEGAREAAERMAHSDVGTGMREILGVLLPDESELRAGAGLGAVRDAPPGLEQLEMASQRRMADLELADTMQRGVAGMEEMPVTELRKILRERGQPTGGGKEELLRRIRVTSPKKRTAPASAAAAQPQEAAGLRDLQGALARGELEPAEAAARLEGGSPRPALEVVDSTHFRGERYSPRMGPNDNMLVAKDAAGKEQGFIWYTREGDGNWSVRRVEVAPEFQRQGVATELYRRVGELEGGRYTGSTAQTPAGQGLVSSLRERGVLGPPGAAGAPAAAGAAPGMPGGPAAQQAAAAAAARPSRLPFQSNFAERLGLDRETEGLWTDMVLERLPDVQAQRRAGQLSMEDLKAPERLAMANGMTVRKYMETAPGTIYNAEDLAVLDSMVARTGQRIPKLAEAVEAAKAGDLGNLDKARVELAAAIYEHQTLLKASIGSSSETGRALRSRQEFMRALADCFGAGA